MLTTTAPWMLYGAYGTTGRLIVDAALRRGHRPLLAGRNAARLRQLERATGLTVAALALDRGTELRASLSTVRCVVVAAGPYELTGPAMRAACLDARCSYLDINADVHDFVQALACDESARAAGVAVIPGAGYGVVFGECLAGQVMRRMPDATSLRLSLATENEGRSRGATLSVAAALARGGAEVLGGELRKRPVAFSTWRAPQPHPTVTRFAAVPRAELVAVHRSTGVPNIVTGVPMSRAAVAVVRAGGPWLGRLIARVARGPSDDGGPHAPESAIATMRSRIWAEASNHRGDCVMATLGTGEGYRAAAAAAVLAVESLLDTPRTGALTPVQAFGADFALRVPGTDFQELHND